MIDLTRATTPAGDGDVLLLPDGPQMRRAASENAALFAALNTKLLDTSLRDVRSAVRRQLAPDHQGPFIVVGHQPEFFHAGVWAKLVAADRLAADCGGQAIHIGVDHDVPREPALRIPSLVADGWTVKRLTLPWTSTEATFEDLDAWSDEDCRRLETAARQALGSEWPDSRMPHFFQALRSACGSGAWTRQLAAARQAVDARFSINVRDVTASALPLAVFAADLLISAPRFASIYNAALAQYRRVHKVRGRNRPIPDLTVDGGLCEAPFWLTRPGSARRRCHVRAEGEQVELWAEDQPVAAIPLSALRSSSTCQAALENMGGWRLRPRALALTLWARMFLADLFIHGIGGAKYDRITDDLIRRYYAAPAPPYACVSATLQYAAGPTAEARHLPAGHERITLRDLRYNPQRHAAGDGRIGDLLRRRAEAIEQSGRMREAQSRDRTARRRVFDAIRVINAQILAQIPDRQAAAQEQEVHAAAARREARILGDREYFFALFADARLRRLCEAVRRRLA